MSELRRSRRNFLATSLWGTLGAKLAQAAPGKIAYPVGVVHPSFGHHHADVLIDANQPERLARRAQSRLHFRTNRHPFDEEAKCLHQIAVALVPAVVANFFAQQAGRYSNADGRTSGPAHAFSLQMEKLSVAANATQRR